MFKSVKLWLTIIIVAAFVWFFRKDLGVGSQEYPVRMMQIPTSNYGAVAQGKIDIQGGVVEISARSGGTYREVFVEEGDIVKAGQVLAVQEDDLEQMSVRNAEISLKSANSQLKGLLLDQKIQTRELERLKPLVAIDATSSLELQRQQDTLDKLDIQIEQQQNSILQSQSSLDRAKFDLDLKTIRAPRDGRIIEVKARPGVGASTMNVSTAFTLMPDAQKIVRANLNQEFVGQVKVGQKAIISPDSRPNETYEGEVIRVSEIFGRSSGGGSQSSGGMGGGSNEFSLEVVVGAGNIPLLIGQRVLVRFSPGDNAQGAGQAQRFKKPANHAQESVTSLPETGDE